MLLHGSIQLCAGQIAGVEAAIHFMREIYSAEDCEAVFLVDASNAFNSLNRECALPGAHKRKERSAAIYPNVNSAARCARRVSDDVYYQQSKESDVGSLAHAQQSSQSR